MISNHSLPARLAWMLDVASNFRLPLLLVAVVCWLVSFIYIDTLFVTIALCIAIVCTVISIFPLSSWVSITSKNDSHNLTVTTFNIQWNIDGHDKCFEYIQSLESDIVILQEVTDATRNKINQLTQQYPYQFGTGKSHTMVLSRIPFEKIDYIEWPGKFENRAILFSVIIEEQTINFIGLHLQVTRSHSEIVLREQQIQTLIKTCHKLQGKTLIIVGDFNAAVGSRVLNKILTQCQLTTVNSLLSYLPTWPSKFRNLGIQIDNYLIRGNVCIQRTVRGPMTESDHRPLTAMISV